MLRELSVSPQRGQCRLVDNYPVSVLAFPSELGQLPERKARWGVITLRHNALHRGWGHCSHFNEPLGS
eukprot:1141771-Pelagomonas_calceolata.AAC.3